jgi:hypothetical protein
MNLGLRPSPRRAPGIQCLMDSFVKQELLDRLAEIEAGIATDASNISRQREQVAELERVGLDAKLSSVLKSFEDSQAVRREELGRLLHELGSSGSEPKPA